MDDVKKNIIKEMVEETGIPYERLKKVIYEYENCVVKPIRLNPNDLYDSIIMYRFGTFSLKKNNINKNIRNDKI